MSLETVNSARIPQKEKALPRHRNTSSTIWVLATALILTLLTLRSQQLLGTIFSQVALSDAAKSLTDPAMKDLAVYVGLFLGVLLSTALAAVYFSLSSIAETTFFPTLIRGRGRARIGVFAASAIFSLVGVQFFSFIFGLASPKDHAATIVCVAIVGVSVPFLYSTYWFGKPKKPIIMMFAGSLSIASASLFF